MAKSGILPTVSRQSYVEQDAESAVDFFGDRVCAVGWVMGGLLCCMVFWWVMGGHCTGATPLCLLSTQACRVSIGPACTPSSTAKKWEPLCTGCKVGRANNPHNSV
jgi:hypothetical protein